MNAMFGIIGSIAGLVIGHCLTVRRDRAGRKRTFQAFLRKWQSEASAPYRGPTVIGINNNAGLIKHDTMCAEFRSHIENVRDIWGNDIEFIKLCGELTNFHTASNKDALGNISYDIQNLVDFCLKH